MGGEDVAGLRWPDLAAHRPGERADAAASPALRRRRGACCPGDRGAPVTCRRRRWAGAGRRAAGPRPGRRRPAARLGRAAEAAVAGGRHRAARRSGRGPRGRGRGQVAARLLRPRRATSGSWSRGPAPAGLDATVVAGELGAPAGRLAAGRSPGWRSPRSAASRPGRTGRGRWRRLCSTLLADSVSPRDGGRRRRDLPTGPGGPGRRAARAGRSGADRGRAVTAAVRHEGAVLGDRGGARRWSAAVARRARRCRAARAAARRPRGHRRAGQRSRRGVGRPRDGLEPRRGARSATRPRCAGSPSGWPRSAGRRLDDAQPDGRRAAAPAACGCTPCCRRCRRPGR